MQPKPATYKRDYSPERIERHLYLSCVEDLVALHQRLVPKGVNSPHHHFHTVKYCPSSFGIRLMWFYANGPFYDLLRP